MKISRNKVGLAIFVSLLMGISFVWGYNNLKRDSKLCTEGGRTFGYIYKVEKVHKVEGSIKSYDGYYYFDVDSVRYKGILNNHDEIAEGRIEVRYFKETQ